ncbi:MAG: hypothetical protein U5L98_12885 [Halomonas sp.]|uniref:hypothetical protein n=1 Tax=Halomonas sp. TaxID=1486246 RepID=UPI002ACDD4AE|nr:hypothetical protein [Halomonas sp.]MDZ7853502.1 hypothetical protein [Halomonas sp.]
MARYRQWLEDREQFDGMAYAALTLIEAKAGGRKNAAKHYNIDQKVLARLGELVSTGQGDPREVRKFKQGGPQPMAPEDREWLRKVVPAIIIHVAAVEAGSQAEKLTMANLL